MSSATRWTLESYGKGYRLHVHWRLSEATVDRARERVLDDGARVLGRLVCLHEDDYQEAVSLLSRGLLPVRQVILSTPEKTLCTGEEEPVALW